MSSGERDLLSAQLSERMQALGGDAVTLVLEAFDEGRAAGAGRLAEQLIQFIFAQLVEVRRQYEELSSSQIAMLERSHQGGTHPPVIEAHFGGVGSVLNDVHAEICRIHPNVTLPEES